MPVIEGEIKELERKPTSRVGGVAMGLPLKEDFQYVRRIVQLSGLLRKRVLVGSLRDGRLRVYSPFKVKFTIEGHNVIAEAIEFNEFGFGENASEALIDLQRAIAELYFTLEGEQHRLSPDLQNVWSVLQEKIQKIQKQ